MRQLVESSGGEVAAAAVIVSQPSNGAKLFADVPFYSLAEIAATDVPPAECEQFTQGVPLEKVLA